MAGPRYSIIPARFFDDDRLKPSHFKVMGYLGKHSDKSGWMKLSQTKAAGDGNIGLARETVCRAISDLVAWGYVDKRTKQETKRSICFYRILMDDPLDPAEEVPDLIEGCDVAITGGCDRTDHRVVTARVTRVVTAGVTTNNDPSPKIKSYNSSRSEDSNSDLKVKAGTPGVLLVRAFHPDELAAWRRFALHRGGIAMRRLVYMIDTHGGASVPSQWPPDAGLSKISKRTTGDAA